MRQHFTATTLSLRFQPLFAVAVCFILGILLGHYARLSIELLLSLLIGVLILAWLAFWRERDIGILLLGACLLTGAILIRLEQLSLRPDRLRAQLERGELRLGEPAELIGTLAGAPEPAPDRVYLDLAVEQVAQLKIERPASGLIRLSLLLPTPAARQELAALRLAYGQRMRVLTIINRLQQYRNPGLSDYDQYLFQQGYDLVASLKSPLLIEPLGEGPRNPWLARLYRGRLQAMAAFDASFDPQSAALLKAGLLGNRYFLDDATEERFLAGGTFHLLVISGSHIAFGALVGSWLLAGLTRSRWLRLGVLLPILWSYTAMIGAQPPVLRAAVAVTIALLADALWRARFSLNLVAAAALVLLVFKPSELFSASFQLTFLTVALIVLVALPLLERLRAIGQWSPSPAQPYPPQCPRPVRWLAEVAYWSRSDHEREQQGAAMQYQLEKARAALLLDRLRLQWLVRSVLTVMLVSAVIQFGLLPVMAVYFNRVALVGILLNITVSLLLVAFFAASGLVFLAQPFSPTVASFLAGLVQALRFLLIENVTPFLPYDWLSFRVPHYSGPAAGLYGLYFGPLLYAIFVLHRWQPLRLADPAPTTVVASSLSRPIFLRPQTLVYGRHCLIALAAVILFVLTALAPIAPFQPGHLSVAFLDVGHGDAILIRFPAGTTMLVDSGGRPRFPTGSDSDETPIEVTSVIGENVVSRYLWAQGLTRLDYLVATHGDADHIEGFQAVVKNFKVSQALTGLVPGADPVFRQFQRALQQRRVPLRELLAGESLTIDGVRLEVLHPGSPADRTGEATNNHSLVLRLVYGARSILLTGDIERETERELLAVGEQLKADVLKVPHHGSRTSSTEAFLAAVRPAYAVISVGEQSRFGHPHPEVLARYQGMSVRLFQTGRDGTVTITTDGQMLTINTFVPPLLSAQRDESR